MRIAFTISLVLISMLSWASPSTPYYDSLFVKGNNAYREQAYDSALDVYNQILAAGLESADLYYNMGNAHFKLRQIPSAILYYEKALLLQPNNPDYSYNLNIANTQIVDEITPLPVPFYQRWIRQLVFAASSFTWAIAILVSLAGVFLSGILFAFSPTTKQRQITFFTGVVCLVCLGAFFFFAHSQYTHKEKQPGAIVFSERASIYSEPNERTTQLFVVHEGLKVRIEEAKEDWIRVTLPDGSSGWMVKASVQAI